MTDSLLQRLLREYKTQLDEIQSQARVGMWKWDADGLIKFTGRACEILGLKPGTRVDLDEFFALVHPDERAFAQSAWLVARSGYVPYDAEHRVISQDGKLRWVHSRARLEVDSHGGITSALGTIQDITEHKAHEGELSRSRDQLRQLAAHREQIREDERRHLAREAHDQLGQYLSSLRMEATMLEMRYGDALPEISNHVKNMLGNIDAMIASVRNISTMLRPAALNMGLIPAVRWLLDDFSQRSGIRHCLEQETGHIRLDEQRTTTLFRILQEAITNISRHANASEVWVRVGRPDEELCRRYLDAMCLALNDGSCANVLCEPGCQGDSGDTCMRQMSSGCWPHDGDLCMLVCDDGKGFDIDQVTSRLGFGLMGMRERAAIIGGGLSIRSKPDEGTFLCIRIHSSTGAPSHD